MELIKDVAILNLDTTGFESLTLKQKSLVYHLSEAGLKGRDIIYVQNNKYNLVVKTILESMYNKIQENKSLISVDLISPYNKFIEYLKLFWFHQGIYNSLSNKKITPDFTIEEFNSLMEVSFVQNKNELYEIVISVLFKEGFVPEYKICRDSEKDLITDSGVGFYDGGITVKEANDYRNDVFYNGDSFAQYGMNSFLSKTDSGEIKETVASANGFLGEYISGINSHLTKALEFTENKYQRESIEHLITFYETGNPEYFDKHSLAWVKDTESDIFFINGFIESYDDPLGVACSFESLVAFKNPNQTKKVDNIIDNIQWFEDNLPIDKEFKKDKAVGLSASSITVCSMSGSTSPTLPLGICLPNSDWIRAKHGSKSVNLMNVHNGVSSNNNDINNEFYLPEHQDNLYKYASIANSLHTDLHEITGHGSAKSNDGVKNEDLGEYYSIIEECRADLVGLYYISNPKLKAFGIIDVDSSGNDIDMNAFSEIAYLTYLTKGLFTQLTRVEVGNNLAQTHMRNRYLISSWVLANSLNNEAELIEKNNKTFVKINDVEGLNNLFGQLLKEIQRIKSEADFFAAEELIENFGTIINIEQHKEVIKRVESINPPKQFGFLTPIIQPIIEEESDVVVDYIMKSSNDFSDDQSYLSKKYSS